MAYLHSCCFWRTVRSGSYASAIYTLFYFGTSCIIVSVFLHDEKRYLSGEVERPTGESFLEREKISPTTVIFNILLLICASCGVITSILVLIGLKTDQRELLLPWILNMITDILVEVAHFIYLIILETLQFEPLTATLFTIDFFIMCLNVYCLFCVISQYQEYKVGRGVRHEIIVSHVANVRYTPPSPTHAYIKSNRQLTATTSNCPHSNCVLITEESHNAIEKSPFIRSTSNNNSLKKKHVQFPDELKGYSEVSVLEDQNGNGNETNLAAPNTNGGVKLWLNPNDVI